jgi:hypothetical protein
MTHTDLLAAYIAAVTLVRWADSQVARLMSDGCTEAEANATVAAMAEHIDAGGIAACVAARLSAPDAPARLH